MFMVFICLRITDKKVTTLNFVLNLKIHRIKNVVHFKKRNVLLGFKKLSSILIQEG